jgi:hypothetical protein
MYTYARVKVQLYAFLTSELVKVSCQPHELAAFTPIPNGYQGGWKDLKETVCGDVDWIYLAQDRDQWRALVKTIMKPWVP